ncbi:MAG: hypothetical protein FGM41_07325 [Bacteroidetes bacterium]|nr:hypothetical protein [Bacteroidota bacterium]
MSVFSKKTTYIPIYFFSFGFFVLLVTILTKNRYQRIALIFNVIFYYLTISVYHEFNKIYVIHVNKKLTQSENSFHYITFNYGNIELFKDMCLYTWFSKSELNVYFEKNRVIKISRTLPKRYLLIENGENIILNKDVFKSPFFIAIKPLNRRSQNINWEIEEFERRIITNELDSLVSRLN